MVILSKTILSNFCPKQAKEWIGAFVFWIIELFIAILTWPNLTGYNSPLSLFFHPLTPQVVGGSWWIFERTVFERTTYLGADLHYLCLVSTVFLEKFKKPCIYF